MQKIINLIKCHWRRTLTLAALAAIGTFAALTVYKQGVSYGRVVGHCEVACGVMGSTLVSATKDSSCECVSPYGTSMNIPLDHGFFK